MKEINHNLHEEINKYILKKINTISITKDQYLYCNTNGSALEYKNIIITIKKEVINLINEYLNDFINTTYKYLIIKELNNIYVDLINYDIININTNDINVNYFDQGIITISKNFKINIIYNQLQKKEDDSFVIINDNIKDNISISKLYIYNNIIKNYISKDDIKINIINTELNIKKLNKELLINTDKLFSLKKLENFMDSNNISYESINILKSKLIIDDLKTNNIQINSEESLNTINEILTLSI